MSSWGRLDALLSARLEPFSALFWKIHMLRSSIFHLNFVSVKWDWVKSHRKRVSERGWRDKRKCMLRQVADKSLRHFLESYASSILTYALFEFLLIRSKKNKPPTYSCHSLMKAKMWKAVCARRPMERKKSRKIFTFRSPPDGLLAHTSWRDFFVVRLNWCREISSRDFCREFEAWYLASFHVNISTARPRVNIPRNIHSILHIKILWRIILDR